MAAEVKILIEGYTNADSVIGMGEEKTRPTISLVRDGDIVMVVDPGVLDNQQILVDALKKENLTVQDVNVVCITHSHIDHYRNIGMFPHAKTLEYFGLWNKQTVDAWPEKFTSNIQILHTPGHDYTGITLLVTTEPESRHPGVVAICGDVFWKENYPRDPRDDAFASNPERLKESREMVMKMADWIIPGHGPIYKNDKNAVLLEEEESLREAIKNEAKIAVTCKKCHRQMSQKDKCECRPYLCFHCCECGMDCGACSCSHKR
ncbi:MAG: MBL fold metallo-hydrolase [Candidatus Staskawiczbacteria bacterium]|nr:MBL fold metallo-hydrolase [Candidatus Staskawiczbacteria bacterium]